MSLCILEKNIVLNDFLSMIYIHNKNQEQEQEQSCMSLYELHEK